MDSLFFGRVRARDGVDALPADFPAVGRLVPALLALGSYFTPVPRDARVKRNGASLERLGAERLLCFLRDVREVRLRVGRGGRRVEGDTAALS